MLVEHSEKEEEEKKELNDMKKRQSARGEI